MRRAWILLFLVVALPSLAAGQIGGGARSRGGFDRPKPSSAPTAPVSEAQLDGPMTPTDFQHMFGLTDDEAKRYGQVQDSFAAATQLQRDSARRELERLREAALTSDTPGTEYHTERLKELSKFLKEEQGKFDDRVKRLLTKDQAKEYESWRKQVNDAPKAVLPLPRGRSGR